MLLRGPDLAAGMSRYLVDQVQAQPRIDVCLRTQIRELHGNGDLQGVTVECDGETRRIDARAVFVFIGAEPCTDWLDDALAIDDDGFVLTGHDLQLTHLDPIPGTAASARRCRSRRAGRACSRRRRALGVDQARRVSRRRGRDGSPDDPSVPRAPRRGGGALALVDLVAAGREDVPLGAELVEALPVGHARAAVADVVVQRVAL
jgi:hypothetical protein